MNIQFKIAAFAGILAFTGCTKDATIVETETANLASQLVNAKEQDPLVAFDTDKKGIYAGVIVAGHSQDRGNIWINVNNNGQYTAHAEMIGGDVIEYISQNDFLQASDGMAFSFEAPNSSFVLDLSQTEAVVHSATLNNELYFIEVIKSTSTRNVSTVLGTFADPVNTSFNGTWCFILSGTDSNNVANVSFEDLSELIVTYNGYTDSDTSFTNFDASACAALGAGFSTNFVPAATPAGIVAAISQTSSLFGNTASWNIARDQNDQYRDENCNLVASGTFSWSNTSTNYSGTVTLD